MNEPEEDVTVDVDGVSLRKALNDHQFETLAVVFDIRSGGAAAVSVTDAIPEGVAADDIGFHPEYGGEHWRAEGGEVVFSRDFEPGEQYTTVYGVRDFDGDRDELLAEPSVDVDLGGSVGDIDDLVSEEDSDVVREVIAGERDTLPGLEAEATGEPAAAETADGSDEAEVVPTTPTVGDDDGADGPDEAVAEADDEEEPEVSATGADDGAPAEAPGAVAGDDDEAVAAEEDEPATSADADVPDVAEASVDVKEEAADEGEAADDEVTVPVTGGIARVLAKELRAGNISHEDRRLLRQELLPDDGSTDARIRRLQTQVADFAAYTDALEAFLDEEGGAEAVLGEVQDEVSDLADDLADLDGSVDDVSGQVDDLAGTVDQVEGDLDEVVGDVEEVSATTGRLTRDVDDLRDDVGRIDEHDRRLAGVEDDVASIRDELEGLAEFRERLSSVFGAGGVGGAAAESDDADDSDDDY